MVRRRLLSCFVRRRLLTRPFLPPPSLPIDVDIYSTSSIHQGVSTIDYSLKIQPKAK